MPQKIEHYSMTSDTDKSVSDRGPAASGGEDGGVSSSSASVRAPAAKKRALDEEAGKEKDKDRQRILDLSEQVARLQAAVEEAQMNERACQDEAASLREDLQKLEVRPVPDPLVAKSLWPGNRGRGRKRQNMIGSKLSLLPSS